MRHLQLLILSNLLSVACAVVAADLDWVTEPPVAKWIWDANPTSEFETIYLQKKFQLSGEIQSAELYTTCDNGMTLWINGKEAGKCADWPQPLRQDIEALLETGTNTIAVKAQNKGGAAGFVFKLKIRFKGNDTNDVVSDASWVISQREPSTDWFAKSTGSSLFQDQIVELGQLGVAPWGIPGTAKPTKPGSAASNIATVQDFAVDHVYTVPSDQQGSWVALTVAPDGALLASDQGDKGLFRVVVTETEDGPSANVQKLEFDQPLSAAQGLLYAFDSLWVHRNGGNLYRVTDKSSDGKLESIETVPSETGGGEHGNHAVILTADGQGIYLCSGNHAPMHMIAGKRVQSWQEDLLLPRRWDANGHARGVLAPGGWVTRLDPNTYQQELFCIGFRNQYDIAINRHGDMFTYDADMEWDMGMPWYRPTRICHLVSGGDFGWRSGTGKWPTYYEDSLPPLVEIGPGSPTGVVFGTEARFPARYQDALYALDWTFGTIYAVHMTPQGAGYVGTSEPFVTGAPLPVTDAVVGTDGFLYFTVGGRGAQSGLYRVRYAGTESTAPQSSAGLSTETRNARRLRREMEALHGNRLAGTDATAAINAAFPLLGSSDRFLRHAARVAIESQDPQLWAGHVMDAQVPQVVISGSVALARSDESAYQAALIDKLLTLESSSLPVSQQLGLLRALSLTCIRLGKPDSAQRQAMLAELEPLLPSEDDRVNTELIKMLVYLESPQVVKRAMQLINNPQPPQIPEWSELASRNAGYGGVVNAIMSNHPPAREIAYAFALRHVSDGWTLTQRREYLMFLNDAAQRSGGASYPGFMKGIREDFVATFAEREKVALQDLTGESYEVEPDFEIHPAQGPGQKWTLDGALNRAGDFSMASFEHGRSLYFAAGCGKCHRHAGLGGSIGPDLTSIPSKFDLKYVIEHTIEPNKVISDQYQSKTVLTVDGRTLSGLVSQADGKTVIYPADVNADPITIEDTEISAIKPSEVSQMPQGLIDGLNSEELRDLLAYLMSGGDPENERVYQTK